MISTRTAVFAATLLVAALVVGAAAAGGHDRAGPGAAAIAFSSDGHIFTIAADGGDRRQLTAARTVEDDDGDAFPEWSPDGSTIAFTRTVEAGRDRFGSSIFVIGGEGGEARPLTELGAPSELQPSWAPDGSRLALTRVRERRDGFVTAIVVRSLETGAERVLARERARGDALISVGEPTWSPDGARIAYTRARLGRDFYLELSVHVVDADGGDGGRLLADAASPAYSPDGSRLAVASIRDRNGESCGSDECTYNAEIYTVAADGGDLRRLTNSTADDSEPAWSADGSRIVFASARERRSGFGTPQLHSIGADGGCRTVLTAGKRGSSAPDWRPGLAPAPVPLTCALRP